MNNQTIRTQGQRVREEGNLHGVEVHKKKVKQKNKLRALDVFGEPRDECLRNSVAEYEFGADDEDLE